jgi:hypothetical protein
MRSLLPVDLIGKIIESVRNIEREVQAERRSARSGEAAARPVSSLRNTNLVGRTWRHQEGLSVT